MQLDSLLYIHMLFEESLHIYPTHATNQPVRQLHYSLHRPAVALHPHRTACDEAYLYSSSFVKHG